MGRMIPGNSEKGSAYGLSLLNSTHNSLQREVYRLLPFHRLSLDQENGGICVFLMVNNFLNEGQDLLIIIDTCQHPDQPDLIVSRFKPRNQRRNSLSLPP